MGWRRKEQLYRLNKEKQLYGLQTTGTAVWIGEERNSSTGWNREEQIERNSSMGWSREEQLYRLEKK